MSSTIAPPKSAKAAAPRAISAPMLLVLALVSGTGPLALDMYLPAMPEMAPSLGTTGSSIQLTLTAFTMGMAFGQLLAGPVSDGRGRRFIMLTSCILATAASAACALSPSIWFLVGARLVHGFVGGAAAVLARSAVGDRAKGAEAAKLFSLLMLVSGVAPVAAPLMGGLLLGPFGWRGIFWALTALSVVMVVGVAVWVPETLPAERRHAGGMRSLVVNVAAVARNRSYMGYALALVFGFAALFSYISASPFVLQNVLGLSASASSIVFAVIALGMMPFTFGNTILLRWFSPRQALLAGTIIVTGGGAIVLIEVLVFSAPPLWAILPPLFFGTAAMGLVFGNATALAQGEAPQAVGTASALMGFLQFMMAAAMSPLMTSMGDHSALPMAVAIPTCGLIAVLSVSLLARQRKTELVSSKG
jgi:DHA1 family bicyclomycin/chloramphenicol resistance-like MFS transporter